MPLPLVMLCFNNFLHLITPENFPALPSLTFNILIYFWHVPIIVFLFITTWTSLLYFMFIFSVASRNIPFTIFLLSFNYIEALCIFIFIQSTNISASHFSFNLQIFLLHIFYMGFTKYIIFIYSLHTYPKAILIKCINSILVCESDFTCVFHFYYLSRMSA